MTKPLRTRDNLDVAWEAMLILLLLTVPLSLDLMDSGMPSHLELTLGTLAGNFCGDTLSSTMFPAPPFSDASLRCCWANCSSAEREGSLSVRKLSTPLLFFFFLLALGSFDVGALEARLAVAGVLGMVLEPKSRRIGDDVGVLAGVKRRWSMVASLDAAGGDSDDEVSTVESDD